MPARDKELQFAVIEGAAVVDGATGETTLDLSDTRIGVSPITNVAMEIYKVELGFLGLSDFTTAAPGSSDTGGMSLRTITSTALPDFTDDGVITHKRISVMAGATLLPVIKEQTFGEVYPQGLLIAADNLFLFYNNEQFATNTPGARIWYRRRTLAPTDWREVYEVWGRP